MSFTLRVFNILLKVFSRRGLGNLHITDDTAPRFVEHATKMDNIAARFIKINVHPVIATDQEHWVWVGDPTKTKRHILYLHGGGFIAHMPKTYRYWADRLATMNDACAAIVEWFGRASGLLHPGTWIHCEPFANLMQHITRVEYVRFVGCIWRF